MTRRMNEAGNKRPALPSKKSIRISSSSAITALNQSPYVSTAFQTAIIDDIDCPIPVVLIEPYADLCTFVVPVDADGNVNKANITAIIDLLSGKRKTLRYI